MLNNVNIFVNFRIFQRKRDNRGAYQVCKYLPSCLAHHSSVFIRRRKHDWKRRIKWPPVKGGSGNKGQDMILTNTWVRTDGLLLI